MTRNEIRSQHAANFVVGATGLGYFWLKYIARNPDPYSAAGNPWQPFAHDLHLFLAPLLVFAVGLIWTNHVWRKIVRHRQRRRRTGVLIAVLFVPMVVSAYGLQVAVDDGWRKAWVLVHLVTSGAWILGYLVHLATKPKP